jgi:PKD repeat protein
MLRDWLIEPSTYTIVSGNLTSQDIPISFSANGQYDITLSTFNEGGSSTTTKENYITITDVPLAPSKTMLFVK